MDIIIGVVLLLLINAFQCHGRNITIRLVNLGAVVYVGSIVLRMFGFVSFNWILLALSFPVVLIITGLIFGVTKKPE